MKVCIAEKPSVAREIAFILGAKNKLNGYFEGNGYQVTWTFGHLCELYTPDDYQADWKKWNLNTLPMLPERFEIKLKKNKGISQQFKIIKQLFRKASVVINCGDAGQEGELIQRWVIQHAKYKGKVERLWISSLTPEAIRKGFQQLKDASDYDSLYHAGSSRAIGDWLLGMNATRLYTLRYGGFKQTLSVGRVQTPTLAMLVQRHKEIENFVPEPYWELQTLYKKVVFNCELGKFKKQEDGEKILNKVKGHPFEIISTTQKKGKEYAPKLFDLTGLQVYSNNKFGLSADETLKIAQKLYETKLISYPRVDTTYLPNDVYPKAKGILGKLSNYQKFTQVLLQGKLKKSSKVFNDKKITDHHAIIPTGVQKNLGFREQQVFDIICRRFIAVFYPECLVNHTTVQGEANTVKFKAKGKEILDKGWRVVFEDLQKKKTNTISSDKKGKKGKEEEKILPPFKKGESGEHQAQLIKKMTQAPKNYTEASLLRSMETAGKQVEDESLREIMKANGIGRPSTRANIIETLFRRKYIQRKKKLILPTTMGIQLIDTIQNNLLKSAELTGQWESKLKEIEQGKYHAGRFIQEMKSMVSAIVQEVKSARNVKRLEMPTTKWAKKAKGAKSSKKSTNSTINSNAASSKNLKSASQTKTNSSSPEGQSCPKCKQGQLLKGKTAYGCNQWKNGCDFRLPFSFMEKTISEKQYLRLLEKGSTITLKGFQEGERKINGKVIFSPNFQLVLEPTEAAPKAKPTTPSPPKKEALTVPDPLPCPKCGTGHIIRGKTAYGCNRWKEGCDFRYAFDLVRENMQGKSMTKMAVWELLKSSVD